MQNPNKPIWFGEESVVETIDLSEPKPESPNTCLLYTSPSPRDGLLSRMPSSA